MNMEKRRTAIIFQQYYYEHLPDWFSYNFNDRPYIKQNIAFALFGPSKNQTCMSYDDDQGSDMFNEIMYNKESCQIVNNIYEAIITHGVESNNIPIFIGIIYNIIFNNEDKFKENSNEVHAIPVFKLKKTQFKKVWYIDVNARVYESWEDYIKNNTLPECTMVVPKDGIYQCNPMQKVTKQSSAVWVVELASPTSAITNTVLNVVDIASNILAVATTGGIGIASLFTPIGPTLAITGLVTAGVSGAWNIGHSTRKLINRYMHKQSISPLNRDSFSAWLGIAGTVLTVGTNGGTMLLSRAITRGASISTAAEIAYNSLLISNLTVRGVGIVFQGYCIIDNYIENKEISILDVLTFSSQMLFYSNAVLTVKLAGDLIESSRGTILDRLKNALRFNRFRAEFYRVNKSDSGDEQNKSEGIVCQFQKITTREGFLNSFSALDWSKTLQRIYDSGKSLNGTLLDPFVFAGLLLAGSTAGSNLLKFNSLDSMKSVTSMLPRSLSQLLTNFYSEKKLPLDKQLPDVSYFKDILNEMKHMHDPIDILQKVFKVAVTVIEHSNEPEKLLVVAVYFVWEYSKANLKALAQDACSTLEVNKTVYSALNRIITFVYEIVDVISNELFSALYTYLINKKALRTEQY